MSRRLALVDATGAPDAGALALDALAEALLPRLRARLAAEAHEAELLDVLRAIPAPKRCLLAACRRGEIIGAARVGRRWIAPRSAIDAFLQRRGQALAAREGDGGSLGALRARVARSIGSRGAA